MSPRTFDKICSVIGFCLILSGGSCLIQPLKIMGKNVPPITLIAWGVAILLFVITSVLIEILEELQKRKQ
jgi:hypothetical protein